jgi:hypothetical protein
MAVKKHSTINLKIEKLTLLLSTDWSIQGVKDKGFI